MLTRWRSLSVVLLAFLLLLPFSGLTADQHGGSHDSILNRPDAPYQVALEAELGYIGVLEHTYRNGLDSTSFNYRTQGGQDILFPLVRLAAEVTVVNRHTVSLLYQPLDIVTQARLREDIKIDNVTFLAGTGNSPLNVRYSFPFWRLTYLYDFFPQRDLELAVGGALQIRNASISFESGDGTKLTLSQNVGPVPSLAVRGGKYWSNGLFVRAEATGLFASSSIINGAQFEFEGSLLDTSVQTGVVLAGGAETFLKLRFLGGSAKGTTQYASRTWSESIERYTTNYLSTVAVSLGFRLR